MEEAFQSPQDLAENSPGEISGRDLAENARGRDGRQDPGAHPDRKRKA